MNLKVAIVLGLGRYGLDRPARVGRTDMLDRLHGGGRPFAQRQPYATPVRCLLCKYIAPLSGQRCGLLLFVCYCSRNSTRRWNTRGVLSRPPAATGAGLESRRVASRPRPRVPQVRQCRRPRSTSTSSGGILCGQRCQHATSSRELQVEWYRVRDTYHAKPLFSSCDVTRSILAIEISVEKRRHRLLARLLVCLAVHLTLSRAGRYRRSGRSGLKKPRGRWPGMSHSETQRA